MNRIPIKVGDKTLYMDKDVWEFNKAFREERERNLKPVSFR